jgi:integrase
MKDGRPLSPVSFNTYRAYLALFFSFCHKRGWATNNPVAGIDVRKVLTKIPRLMSPADLRTALANASLELRPILAIQALCGLRVAEAARLRWEDVLLKPTGNYIQIGANNAKTARRRLTPIPDGLANYLKRVNQSEGFVCAAAKGSVNSLHLMMTNLRESLPKVSWGRNGLRASALSYRLALTKDAAATAFEMGNSPTVLMRDYRELTTPTQALEWFSVEI